MDTDLDVVIVECDQRDSTLRTLTEEEAKGVKIRASTHTGVCTIRTSGNVLCECINRNFFGKYGILGIDDRTTYEKFHFIYDGIPPLNIKGGCDIIDCEIDISEKVARAFELNT